MDCASGERTHHQHRSRTEKATIGKEGKDFDPAVLTEAAQVERDFINILSREVRGKARVPALQEGRAFLSPMCFGRAREISLV